MWSDVTRKSSCVIMEKFRNDWRSLRHGASVYLAHFSSVIVFSSWNNGSAAIIDKGLLDRVCSVLWRLHLDFSSCRVLFQVSRIELDSDRVCDNTAMNMHHLGDRPFLWFDQVLLKLWIRQCIDNCEVLVECRLLWMCECFTFFSLPDHLLWQSYRLLLGYMNASWRLETCHSVAGQRRTPSHGITFTQLGRILWVW